MRPVGFDQLLESIETVLDEVAVVVDPTIDVPERLRLQGVESPLALGADSNESAVVKDPKVAGDPGLADGQRRNKSPYRLLTAAQPLDDAESSRIR